MVPDEPKLWNEIPEHRRADVERMAKAICRQSSKEDGDEDDGCKSAIAQNAAQTSAAGEKAAGVVLRLLPAEISVATHLTHRHGPCIARFWHTEQAALWHSTGIRRVSRPAIRRCVPGRSE